MYVTVSWPTIPLLAYIISNEFGTPEGFILCDDLREILHGFAKEVDLTEDEIDAMIDDIDEDRNGKVSFDGEVIHFDSE